MKIIWFILFQFGALFLFAQTGRYAGSMKNLVGKSYTDSRNIAGLKGWEFREGSVVNSLNDPEMITADVFQKGTTWIVFFSRKDTASTEYTIMDVIEVKSVMKGWKLKTTFCRRNAVENIEIVALVKWSPTLEFLKPAKKAWRFNRDKRRFEILPVKGIDCINEVS